MIPPIQHPPGQMNASEISTSIVGVVSVASRTLHQLYQCIAIWSPAPTEVTQLQDSIITLRQLLESALQAGNTIHGSSAHQELDRELASARHTLSQLDHLLVYVLDDESETVPQATIKAKWSVQRSKVAKLLAEVNGSHQRILVRLASLNMIIATDVFALLPEPQEDPSHTDSNKSLRQNDNDKHLSAEFITQTGYKKAQSRALVPMRAPPSPGEIDLVRQLMPVVMPPPFEQIGQAVSAPRPRTLSHENEVGMQRRDGHNEQKFRHLEQVVSAIASSRSFNPLPAGPAVAEHHETTTHAPTVATRPLTFDDQACDKLCSCKCHSNSTGSRYAAWSLSAFKSTLGAFSLLFTGRVGVACNVASCKSQSQTHSGAAKRVQATYTFPSWLFHCAVAATYTDTSGSPELVIRVLNRLPGSSMRTGIFGYVQRGDMDSVKRLLRRKQASVYDIEHLTGKSPLNRALQWRNIQVIELLLQAGSDPLQADDSGIAPVDWALRLIYISSQLSEADRARLQNAFSMSLILESCGLTTIHKIIMGITPLDLRNYLSRTTLAEINTGDIDNRTPLFYACTRGDAYAVRALLDAGADTEISSKGHIGSPLHTACSNRQAECVQFLLQSGANPLTRTGGSFDLTPLHGVCTGRYFKPNREKEMGDSLTIARELLRYGVDVDVVGKYKVTPLEFAAFYDHEAMVDFLLRSGANPDHRDWEGTNALGNAIVSNGCKAAAVLLERTSDCTNVDDHGHSILHYVATKAGVEMMELFVANVPRLSGLDASLRDKEGKTPMQLFNDRGDVTEQLRETFVRLVDAVLGLGVAAKVDSEFENEDFHDALER